MNGEAVKRIAGFASTLDVAEWLRLRGENRAMEQVISVLEEGCGVWVKEINWKQKDVCDMAGSQLCGYYLSKGRCLYAETHDVTRCIYGLGSDKN